MDSSLDTGYKTPIWALEDFIGQRELAKFVGEGASKFPPQIGKPRISFHYSGILICPLPLLREMPPLKA